MESFHFPFQGEKSLFSQRSPIGGSESKKYYLFFFFIKCRGERPVNGNFPLKHIFFLFMPSLIVTLVMKTIKDREQNIK